MPRRSATPGVFVFKRKDGRWIGRWADPVTGRRRDVTLETLGIKNAEDRRDWAKKKSAELQQRKRDVNLGRHGQTKIDDAIASMAGAMKASRKRPATVYSYRRAAESLGDWLTGRGVRHVEEITPRDLARYRELALAVEAAPATINGHLRCVRVALLWWRKSHLLPQVNPEEIGHACEQIAQDDEPPIPLTPVEVRALLVKAAEAAAREPLFTVAVVVGLLTGMRCGELERLARDQIDLDAAPGGTIKLDAATKTRRGRTIDLVVCPAARDVLRAALGRNAEPFVLGGHKPLDRAVMKRWMHQSGVVDWSWQRLRQTCESFLVCAPGIGWGVYRAARQIGHSVQVAETFYLESVRGIPPEAKTLEAAMQAESEFAAAVRAAVESMRS